MLSIKKCPVPSSSLLANYLADDSYVDCYSTQVPGRISFSDFVVVFYTTPLFKLERAILTWIVSKPSTDPQARSLADGTSQTFAAWRMEGRTDRELLMCDFSGRTRSWFMVIPTTMSDKARTQLYFGSAVVPVQNSKTGKYSIGPVFRALLGFHRLYSILLLSSAASKLKVWKGHPDDS